jgi:tetratricopeptide (TPR) repeat protein
MKSIDTRIVKGAIALLSLVYTIYLFATGHWVSGIFMLLFTAILVLIVLRSIRLILAFFNLRQQKNDKAKTWLSRINPNHLWQNQKGYYYFLMGSTDIDKRNLNESEKYLREALKQGLRMDQDKAVANLNLSVININKRKKREAMHFLNEAKKLDAKGMMKNEIKQIQKAVSSMQ